MKAEIENIITGETVKVHATTEHSMSSYGQKVWIDSDGECYGIASPDGLSFMFRFVSIEAKKES